MTLKYHHPHYTQYTCMPNPVTSCCSVETGTNHLSTLKPPHALAILPSPSLTITNGLAFQVQLLSTHNNRRIPSIPKKNSISTARLIPKTIQTNLKIDSYVGVAVQKENKQSWECIFGLLWVLDDETLNINLWCTLNRYLLKSGLKLLLLFCPS